MKEELQEKYLKEIEELNEKMILPETEVNYERCVDEEEYHTCFDGILEDLLKELGYKEIVEKYEKAQKHFWYS